MTDTRGQLSRGVICTSSRNLTFNILRIIMISCGTQYKNEIVEITKNNAFNLPLLELFLLYSSSISGPSLTSAIFVVSLYLFSPGFDFLKYIPRKNNAPPGKNWRPRKIICGACREKRAQNSEKPHCKLLHYTPLLKYRDSLYSIKFANFIKNHLT